jgi:hypothetical protein
MSSVNNYFEANQVLEKQEKQKVPKCIDHEKKLKEEEEEYKQWLETHKTVSGNRCFTPDRMELYWNKMSDEDYGE